MSQKLALNLYYKPTAADTETGVKLYYRPTAAETETDVKLIL